MSARGQLMCHGLLMYAYACVDGWSSGYTRNGIMSEWVLGCVDVWMGGWARGREGAWMHDCTGVWLSGA